METKEKIKYKKRLVAKCKEYLNASAMNIKSAMDEAQHSANEYGQPKDRYDSYRTQVLRKRDMLGKQLQLTIEQITVLDKIGIDRLHDKVEFGSVVFTEKQKIFVATGIGKLQFEEEDFFVISPKVPIYEAMKGKARGDTFRFRDIEQKIIDVF